MSTPTPLLDFFRRGEADREAKLLAADGVLAPRAHEQLALLILLHDDHDAEIRTRAVATLDRIPIDVLTAFLARSDVSLDVREFFADRGVFPAEIPAIVVDEPLIDTGPEGSDEDEDTSDEARASLASKISRMSFTEKLRAAVKGSREMRTLLIRDPNKMIAASVLSSPKIMESEIEGFARMANVSEEVLRIIATNRAWTKNYTVVTALTRNPKTPIALSLNLLSRLAERDVNQLSIDRNVPEPLRQAARRKIVMGQK